MDTTHAYMVSMDPTPASLRPRSRAMWLSRPTGMNSAVLKMKVPKVMHRTGSHKVNCNVASIVVCGASALGLAFWDSNGFGWLLLDRGRVFWLSRFLAAYRSFARLKV